MSPVGDITIYESPGRQPRMSHACMSKFLDIGRARAYEPGICNQTINPGKKISSDGILEEITVPSKY